MYLNRITKTAAQRDRLRFAATWRGITAYGSTVSKAIEAAYLIGRNK